MRRYRARTSHQRPRRTATIQLQHFADERPGILQVVAVTIHVPDIDAGIHLYVKVLGHRVKWRNDAVGQAGIELPDGDS